MRDGDKLAQQWYKLGKTHKDFELETSSPDAGGKAWMTRPRHILI